MAFRLRVAALRPRTARLRQQIGQKAARLARVSARQPS
jgi:hypothetical protein